MPLASLNRGDKIDIHVHLYEEDVKFLDSLCLRYACSRAAIIGELLRDEQVRRAPVRTTPEPSKG